MSAHNRVVWSEGLFMQPQHFQQQDRYFERYVETLELPEIDATTRTLLEEILAVERHHARELGGKWTMA